MPRAKPKDRYDHLFDPAPPLREVTNETVTAEPGTAYRSWAEDTAAALQTTYMVGFREEISAKIDEILDSVTAEDAIAIGTVKALRLVQKKLDADAQAAKRILHG